MSSSASRTTTRRRRRSFGQISKQRSGRFQASYIGASGERILAPVTFSTRGLADNWLSQQQASIANGTWLDPTKGAQTTIGEFGANCLSTQLDLRPSTLLRNQGYFDRYVVPTLGEMPLAKLDHQTAQAWVAGLSERGLAPRTVQKAGQVLHKIMAKAMAGRYIADNPLVGVSYPKPARSKRIVLSPGEIEKLTESIDKRYRALVPFLCWSGLRIGEAFALRVSDVDLDASPARVTVSRTVVDLGTLAFNEPKTESGNRMVPLVDEVVAELRAHIVERGLGPDDPLFPSARGGVTRLNGWRQRVWNPAVVAAKLDGFNVHQTRRTAVTLWLEYGIPLEVAKVWIGHADLRMILDVYAKPREEAQLALVANVNAALRRPDAKVIPIER
jgi:integrase